MSTVTLPWTSPPLTKNRVRRMHYQACARRRRELLEAVGVEVEEETA